LRAALQLLYCEGWRGLVTYSLDGTLRHVPRIAKEVGFVHVIAGLFWFDDAQLSRERAAALEEVEFIDGFVLGNEGLAFGRYTRQRLETEIATLQADTRRPVSTTEPAQSYLDDPTLLQLGDWVFPNIHPWFGGIRSVPEAVQFVESQVAQLEALAPGRSRVVKESWWPTSGGSAASEQNQAEFFLQLSQTTVKFVYGEAFDQYWKTQEGAQGAHWGFHSDTGASKQVIMDVGEQYRSSYPE
jgi:exo-beta-1,3-glucanase (GH17 family)